MAAIAWADVLSLPNLPATPFSAPGVSVEQQNAILAWVNNTDGVTGLDPNAFDGEGGSSLNLARLYAAAHLALVGPIAAIKTGSKELDLQVTYQLPPIPMGAAFWYRTGFGMAFWDLMMSMPNLRVGFVL
jgi:hypothetical protein